MTTRYENPFCFTGETHAKVADEDIVLATVSHTYIRCPSCHRGLNARRDGTFPIHKLYADIHAEMRRRGEV